MHTELFSLSKIFTENIFRIPDYQRGYSWTAKQLSDFWSDLCLLESDKDHYTGVLTLEDVSEAQLSTWTDDLWIVKAKRFTPYYVVDGQQRLTTSLILLQAILERLQEGQELNYATASDVKRKFLFESKDKGFSRSYIFGYEKDNPSYEFLKTGIFGEHSDTYSTNEDTIYTQNLAEAKTYFLDQLNNFSLSELEDVFTKLTQHFLFNIYTISGDVNVFVAFETMNNRGKDLSNLELLKTRLIYLATRLKADDDDRSKLRFVINEAWKTVYHYLGKNRKRTLNDDHFLYIHFLLYFGDEIRRQFKEDEQRAYRRFGRAEFYKEYLLNHVFTKRPRKEPGESFPAVEPVTVDKVYTYAQDIKKCVKCYYDLFNPDQFSFPPSQAINLLRLDRLGWEGAVTLVVAARTIPVPDETLDEMLIGIERYLFFASLQPHIARSVDLNELALDLRSSRDTLDAITSKINNAANTLNVGESSFFTGTTESYNFYSWRGVRYFLFEYETYLKLQSKAEREKLTWHDFISEDYEKDFVTVEHIFPQKAKGDYWESQFKGFTSPQRKALRNSLGNLLALSRPKNSSLGRRPFPEKRDGLNGSPGYRNGSYSEIDVAKVDAWSPKEILRRGFQMLQFFEKRWKVSLGDTQTKQRLLGLEFLKV